MMDTSKDYYAVLGVLPTTEPTAIRTAYVTLLKKYHPDVYRGDIIEAEKRTKEFNEAYDGLGDGHTREEYDSVCEKALNPLSCYKRDAVYVNVGGSEGEIEKKCNYLSEYYKEIHRKCIEMEKISASLTVSYQIALFEHNVFGIKTARKLAEIIRSGLNRRLH
jgi:curved DNA-binding protein CbpA